MVLAQSYLQKYNEPFAAYMALQCALMRRFVSRGGSEEWWCARLAPAYRRRYTPIFAAAARAHQ